MLELPDWTEFCTNESEHRGLDPLGLEAVGASIVQNRRKVSAGIREPNCGMSRSR